jgi:hypothetical protein
MAVDLKQHRVRGRGAMRSGERSGQELAVLVVDRPLHQRLADALDHAAMRLAFDQEGVHDHPEIVNHRVFHHCHDTGLGINLDLGDVAPIRKCRGGTLHNVLHIERVRANPPAM